LAYLGGTAASAHLNGNCHYGPNGVRFTWEGFDEMDPTFGAGSARLDPDGSLTGEIRFHCGDESNKARRW